MGGGKEKRQMADWLQPVRSKMGETAERKVTANMRGL
jgi:hypothetical protein